MSRHVVAATSEIKPGERKLLTIKGREIGVFNVDGAFFALANRCPHAGGPMCEGRVVGLVRSNGPGSYSITRKGEFVRCPGTAGSSTSAPASPGATPTISRSGNSKPRSSRVPSW